MKTPEQYEEIIKKLIFSNWQELNISVNNGPIAKNSEAMVSINFGVNKFIWRGEIDEKINIPLDNLFKKVMEINNENN